MIQRVGRWTRAQLTFPAGGARTSNAYRSPPGMSGFDRVGVFRTASPVSQHVMCNTALVPSG